MKKDFLAWLKTALSKTAAVCHQAAGSSLVKAFLKWFLGLPCLALIASVVVLLAWSCERRSRQSLTMEAEQAKTRSESEISVLCKQAAKAIQEAGETAQTVRRLEAQRDQLAREARGLRQSLESLRQQETARTGEVATLSAQEVVDRVATRLKNSEAAPVAERPSPGGSEGEGQKPAEAPRQAEVTGTDASLTASPGPALVLSELGARQVETAFVALDSCRQQAEVLTRQVSNCEQRSKLDLSLIEQQKSALAKLNSALADKDAILRESEQAHQTALKAARGTWQSRLLKAVEFIGVGFIAGVLAR